MDREQARSLAAFAQDVHVWYAWTKACDDASRRAYYLSLLSEDETARMQRLAFDHLRFEFLLTRALCRTALSAHLGIPPQLLRFRSGPRGRPELAEQVAGPRLDFNLTNCSSLVACAIARGVEVGIDAERVSAFGDIDTIAQQSLSAREAASMDALAAPRRAERLCELWTLKESYLKARGIGLSVPPTFCGFELGAGDIKASFDPRLEDDPSRWQFRLSAPDPEHRLAVSVRHDGDLRLHIGCTVPGPPDQG